MEYTKENIIGIRFKCNGGVYEIISIDGKEIIVHEITSRGNREIKVPEDNALENLNKEYWKIITPTINDSYPVF